MNYFHTLDQHFGASKALSIVFLIHLPCEVDINSHDDGVETIQKFSPSRGGKRKEGASYKQASHYNAFFPSLSPSLTPLLKSPRENLTHIRRITNKLNASILEPQEILTRQVRVLVIILIGRQAKSRDPIILLPLVHELGPDDAGQEPVDLFLLLIRFHLERVVFVVVTRLWIDREK